MLSVEKAGDIGVGGLRRRLAEQKRRDAYANSARGLLRRGDYTGSRVGPAVLSDGTTLDELQAALDTLGDLTAEQYAAIVNRLDGHDARLRGTIAPAPLVLASAVTAFAPTDPPDVEVVNGVAYLSGTVAPAGSWTQGSTYGIGSLPSGVTGPRRQRQVRAATNETDSSIRLLVSPNGGIQAIGKSSTPAWIDLAALSWPAT